MARRKSEAIPLDFKARCMKKEKRAFALGEQRKDYLIDPKLIRGVNLAHQQRKSLHKSNKNYRGRMTQMRKLREEEAAFQAILETLEQWH
jgi:hypothetical protein